MIVLNPMGGSNLRVIDANGLKDYDVNYKFASYLGKYLRIHGETVILSRFTSEALDQMDLYKLMVTSAPDIIINIKCLEDISPTPSGYTVDCDRYSALAATLSVELNKWGAKPVYPLGYNVQNKSTRAKYTEITLGLGYLTNADDASRLVDDAKMEELAKTMLEAAYGPPTKVMQPSDNVYVPDPYMYSEDKWNEHTDGKVSGDYGALVDTTIENIPSKMLQIQTIDDNRVAPYTFSTNVTIPDPEQHYMVIVSMRCPKNGSVGYVSLGSTTVNPSYNDDAWHRVYFDYTDGDTLYLGAMGGASIEYTAAWVTPKGTMGSLDDPMSQYSIFPPGYRPITQIDPTAVDKSLIQSVVTQANSLMGRAQDTTVPVANSGLQDILTKVDQLAISPKNYISGVQAITNQLVSQDLSKVTLVDPAKIKASIDYSSLQNMVKYMDRGDKRGSMLKAINDMKGVEKAATQLTKTYEDKVKEAQAKSAQVTKRMQAKGEAMSKA